MYLNGPIRVFRNFSIQMKSVLYFAKQFDTVTDSPIRWPTIRSQYDVHMLWPLRKRRNLANQIVTSIQWRIYGGGGE